FEPDSFISKLDNMSFSSLERILNQAIKTMIIGKKKTLSERYLVDAINDEYRRNSGVDKMR
ncbi:TPA: ATP-binding protein, partial [Escherichia coli]